MDDTRTAEVEAVLFASGRFIDSARIAELLNCYQEEIAKAVTKLNETYEKTCSSLHIIEEESAYKLHVRDAFLNLVSQVVSDTELSGPVLETLAIIAWRSPIVQSEVIDIRGSNAYDHIKEITERGFITREPEGRSYRLRITEKFFEYFDIEGREDIREVFKAVEEEHRKKEMELELEQKRLQEAIKAGEERVEEPSSSKPSQEVDLDDLDDVLERAKKRREEMGETLQSTKSSLSEEDDKDEDLDISEAQSARESVERTIEELDK
jgi:segregation and condensation protein B